MEKLECIIAQSGGEILDDDLAAHEWAERFSLMHIKWLGLSLIPIEVILPLENPDDASPT